MMKNPNASSVEAAWQWIAPTLRVAEMFYTENGLPIDQDLSYDYVNRFNTTSVNGSQNLQAQYGGITAKLNLDREPRFYSSLGFDIRKVSTAEKPHFPGSGPPGSGCGGVSFLGSAAPFWVALLRSNGRTV